MVVSVMQFWGLTVLPDIDGEVLRHRRRRWRWRRRQQRVRVAWRRRHHLVVAGRHHREPLGRPVGVGGGGRRAPANRRLVENKVRASG